GGPYAVGGGSAETLHNQGQEIDLLWSDLWIEHLLDGEGPRHPCRLVSVDRAVERVLPGLQVNGEGRLPTGAHRRAVLVDAVPLDRDAVLDAGRRRVVHYDRDLAGLRLEARGRELQGAARVGAQLHGRSLAGRRRRRRRRRRCAGGWGCRSRGG